MTAHLQPDSLATALPRATTRVPDLIRILEAERFPLSTEKKLQGAIAEVLTAAGIAFAREHRLSPRDVVDFWCPPVALETKILGAKRAIYRQCERYCGHAAVEALILATTVPLSLDRLPKPAVVLNLGRAWL